MSSLVKVFEAKDSDELEAAYSRWAARVRPSVTRISHRAPVARDGEVRLYTLVVAYDLPTSEPSPSEPVGSVELEKVRESVQAAVLAIRTAGDGNARRFEELRREVFGIRRELIHTLRVVLSVMKHLSTADLDELVSKVFEQHPSAKPPAPGPEHRRVLRLERET